jgi:hypothetical protein
MQASPLRLPDWRQHVDNLLSFLLQLQNHRLHYTLEHNRGEAIMVLIAVPGQRWEVEFFADGHVEIERFVSTEEGVVNDAGLLDTLLREFGEPIRVRERLTAKYVASPRSTGVGASA